MYEYYSTLWTPATMRPHACCVPVLPSLHCLTVLGARARLTAFIYYIFMEYISYWRCGIARMLWIGAEFYWVAIYQSWLIAWLMKLQMANIFKVRIRIFQTLRNKTPSKLKKKKPTTCSWYFDPHFGIWRLVYQVNAIRLWTQHTHTLTHSPNANYRSDTFATWQKERREGKKAPQK